MKSLLPIAVFVLMVSVGMSLKLSEVVSNWRRLNWSSWARMLLGTFIVPPAIALIAASMFHLNIGETAGLFMIGVAPGAPLLTRNMAKKGFDLQMAASYQVWAALMVPVMIPLLVGLTGRLYDQNIWIPPSVLLLQIAKQQLLPLAVGMAIAWFLPQIIEKVQPIMSTVGNVVLTAIMVFMLYKMGGELRGISPLVPVAAFLIAIGAILAIRLFTFADPVVRQTIAVCNANRHVGLALLLSGHYLHAKNGLPAVFCYALVAPLVMFVYLKIYPAKKPVLAAASAA